MCIGSGLMGASFSLAATHGFTATSGPSAADEKAISVAADVLAAAYGFRPSLLTLLWHMGDRVKAMELNAPKGAVSLVEIEASTLAAKASASPAEDAEVYRRAESILRRIIGYPERVLPAPGAKESLADEVLKRGIRRGLPPNGLPYERIFRICVPTRATGALFSAAEAGDVDAVKVLLQAGTKGNEFAVRNMLLFIDLPALDIAAVNGRVEVVKAFLEHEEKLVEFLFRSQETKLRAELFLRTAKDAVKTCSPSVFIKFATMYRLQSSFESACMKIEGIDSVRAFLERYSDVLYLADQQLTELLAYACAKGVVPTARLLLEAGASPDRAIGFGIPVPEGYDPITRDKNALYIATQMGRPEVATALLEAGAAREGLLAPFRKALTDMATDAVVLPRRLRTIAAATAAGADRREDDTLESAFAALPSDRKVKVLEAIVEGAKIAAYSRRQAAIIGWYDGIEE